jgi:hypothetical protein
MQTMVTVRPKGIHVALLFSLVALGCAARPSRSGGGSEFPSRAELTRLTASPPPAKINVSDHVDVESWKLEGSLPDAIDTAPPEATTPWGKAILDAVKRPADVMATGAMECAARASASFLLEHKTLPGGAVLRFIAGRCGVPTSHLRAVSVTFGNVPAITSDEEVFGAMRGDVEQMLHHLGPGRSFAGLGFARIGDRAGAVLLTADRSVLLERTPLVQSDGRVVLRGELLEPSQRVRALVTAGRFGFAECTQEPSVLLPRFVIVCPLAKADASATVQMVAFPAGRVLGSTVLEAVVFPAEPSPSFSGFIGDEAMSPSDQPAIAKALAEQVNAVRKNAGMPPLRLSLGQSKVASSLAPYYFASTTGSLDPLIADKVALGLMAGWDVEGEVRDGHFSSVASSRREPARLLSELAARPFGRETLFDPKTSALAVGVLAPSDGALGMMIGTYTMFDPAMSLDDEMGRVVDRLTRLRRAKGLPPPRLITELHEDARNAAARVTQGVDPSDALDGMLQDTAGRLQRGGVQGWALTAPSVETLEIPSDLLSRPNLLFAVSVARYRRAGHPWRQLMVFVVALQLEGQGPRTAQVASPRGGAL